MVRGYIWFKCSKCGKRFYALDIEFNATLFSMPQKCPECGSRHTLPAGWDGLFFKELYKKIWKHLDK